MQIELCVRTKDQLREIFKYHFSTRDYIKHYRKEVNPTAYEKEFEKSGTFIKASSGFSIFTIPTGMFILNDLHMLAGIAVGGVFALIAGSVVLKGSKGSGFVDEMVKFMATTENKLFLRNFNPLHVKLIKNSYKSYQTRIPFSVNSKLLPSIERITYTQEDLTQILERAKPTTGINVTSVSKPIIERTQTPTPLNMIPLASLQKIVDKVSSERFSMEMDIVEILKHPVIFDMSFPATKNFMMLMNKVKLYRPESSKVDPNGMFSQSVQELEFAWTFLKNESRRLLLSNFSEEERQRVERARKLISIALDSAVTPHERQAAYKRVVKELEGVIVVPPKAISILEEKTAMLSIESDGSVDQAVR